jgi:hypothetical protein
MLLYSEYTRTWPQHETIAALHVVLLEAASSGGSGSSGELA